MILWRQSVDTSPAGNNAMRGSRESVTGPRAAAQALRRKRVLRSKPKRTTTPRWLKELRK